jgi:hypothetical protein
VSEIAAARRRLKEMKRVRYRQRLLCARRRERSENGEGIALQPPHTHKSKEGCLLTTMLVLPGNGRNLAGMPSQLLRPIITAFRFELPSSPFVTRAKYAISCESRHGSVELRPIALEGVAATMSVSGSCWALPGEQSAELKMFAIVARLTGRISSGMLNKIPEKERLNASRRAATMTSENWFVRTMARSRTVGLSMTKPDEGIGLLRSGNTRERKRKHPELLSRENESFSFQQKSM